MARQIEPLHRGLVTSRDPSLLNEGELQYTKNVRYKPGSPALVRAESRTLVGGGYNFTQPLAAIGVAWDETEAQIIYARPNGAIRYVPAKEDPTSAQMADAVSLPVQSVETPAGSLNRGAETVQYDGEHYIFDGWHPRKLSLTSALAPTLSMLGMPRNDQPVKVAHINVTGSIVTGWHHYWFTWYNNTAGFEREGTASVDAVGRIQLTANKNNLRIFMRWRDFIAFKPAWATHIRLYRSPPQAEELPNPFPNGYRWSEIDISTLTPVLGYELSTYQGYEGTIDPATEYVVLDIDPFAYPTVSANFTAEPFPRASFVIDGEDLSIGRNGSPPRASTADVFEESLICNDLDDRRKVRYSLSGNFNYFPDLYYINFDTRDRDEIYSVRTLGRAAGVFMRGSVWRINWLPRSSANEFGQGRVKELVVDGFGVLGPNLVDSFSLQRPLLAWYGPRGPYATDLVEWFELAPQVDWEAIEGTPIALRNNVRKYRLEVYFVNTVGTGFIYYLHYHPSQVEGGRLPVTGPITPRDDLRGVFTAALGSMLQHVSLDSKGNMYYEGVGEDDVESAFRTRDMYLTGAGREFKVTGLLVHANVAQDVALGELYANPGGLDSDGSAENRFIDTSYGKLDLPALDANGEYVQLGFNNGGRGPFEVNWLGIEFEDMGEVER